MNLKFSVPIIVFLRAVKRKNRKVVKKLNKKDLNQN